MFHLKLANVPLSITLVNYTVIVSNCTNLFLADVLVHFLGTGPGLVDFADLHTHRYFLCLEALGLGVLFPLCSLVIR